MFSRFSEEAQKALINAKREMNNLRHPYVGSEHLFLSILSMKDLEITKVLASYNITYEIFKKELIRIVGVGKESNEWFLYTPLLKRVIETAILNSKEKGEVEVSVNELLLAILEEGEGVAIRLLIGLNIDVDEIYNSISKDSKVSNKALHKKLLVEDFAVNLNKKVISNEVDPVIGRDDEIKSLIEILCRRGKNNPLLIGEAGVGKTAIVEELARRIVDGNVPKPLKGKTILSLPMANLVAGTKYRGEFEERVSKILKELEENDDIIVFIDEVHTIVGAGGAEGAIDASNIIKPALARGKIQLIGATTTYEYHNFIEKDKALNRRFQIIMIEEPTKDKTKEILKKLKPLYEAYHFVSISDDIIDLIVELSDTYIYEYYQPDKSIDILDEVCTKASLLESKSDTILSRINTELGEVISNKKKAIIKQDFDLASTYKEKEKELLTKKNDLELNLMTKRKPKKITKEMVADVIYLKTKIPVYEINKSSRKIINNLDKSLKKIVLGQDEIITDLCNRVKKVRLGFQDKPHIESFLFCGRTGVGKTLLVKEFANLLYGESNFIRLDMSEYKEAHTVSKIIGSPPGYVGFDNHLTVLDTIRMHPHSVILLDEIEKASGEVMKLFLQVLDEGVLTDSRGRKVRFDNVFLFMTTNLGYSNDSIGFTESKNNIDIEEFLGVEFVNRIGKIYYFNDISSDVIHKIVEKRLYVLIEGFKKKDLKIKISPTIVDKIIKESNYPKFGARRVDKVIDEVVTPIIVDAWYNGKKEITV
ncbi:MAG TPA: ATP-dependent Clp protease ATP-binding subunit [Candidatus Onthousia faecipullorum]|uniref:ATP-dependent Clp protease ATP-binding subunit n=1 Tax=Candidatus Onthousia faecipullorum TaxID=2840887 RepID=A0A9D1GBU4_9FIRM|nr:ATP-dependent Clp protease ATP-binding subunit [Candidatus Onthousia faecipullorum]